MDSVLFGFTCRLCARRGITKSDNLPSKICSQCLTALEISYNLVVQCVQADGLLRQQLNQFVKKRTPTRVNSEVLKNLIAEFKSNPLAQSVCSSALKDSLNHPMSEKPNPSISSDPLEYSKHTGKDTDGNNVIENSRTNLLNCNTCSSTFKDLTSFDLHMRTKHSVPSTSSNIEKKNSAYGEQEKAGRAGEHHGVVIKEEHLEEDENFGDNVTSPVGNSDHQKFIEKDKLQNLSLISDTLDPTDSESKARICSVCYVLIETDESMNQHKKIHEVVESICSVCGTTLSSQYDLLIHRRNAHEDATALNIKYFCEKCATFYGNEKDLEKHEQGNCADGSHYCKYCSHQCNTELQLTVHLRKHYDEMIADPTIEKWTCDECGKIFVDRMYYEQHRYTHDPKYTSQFHCPKCNIFFSSAVELNTHKLAMAHNEIESYRCDVCNKEFFSRRNMVEHRRMHKKMSCDHCGIRFTKTKLLNDHLQQEHKLPPKLIGKYVCKICGKDFFKPRLLQDHKNIHSGKAPYNCEQCHKDFRTYAAKWIHQQTHSKSGYVCNHCNQKFVTKNGLRRHIFKFHAEPGQWKYECHVCKDKFAVKSHLWNHMRQNHPGPFTCDVCGNNFAKSSLLKRHKERHVKQEIKKNADSILSDSLCIEDISKTDTKQNR